MKKKPRLTVILGAGSAIKIGFPTSKCITWKLKNGISDGDDIIKKLDIVLKKFYKNNQEINFEDLIYLLEELYSLSKGNVNYRNHIRAFISLPSEYKNYDSEFYLDIIDECINLIRKLFIDATKCFWDNKAEHQWYFEFWKKLSENFYLDIISLNYDNLLESIFEKEFDNGFNINFSNNSVYKFDGKDFLNCNPKIEKHRIIRLHGSINFQPMINHAEARDKTFAKHFDQLEKYEQLDLFWFTNTSIPTKEKIIYFKNNQMISPIISSYNKEEKMQAEPFASYYSILPRIFSASPNMLLIGYAFNQNDIHLNNFIRRMSQHHKGNEKYYIIDHLDETLYDNEQKNEQKKKSEFQEKIYEDTLDRSKTLKIDLGSFDKGIERDERFDDILRFFEK